MASPTLSFNIEDSLVKKLDELVQATERDRQYHLQRAVERYVEMEAGYLHAIEEGMADAAAGRLTDLEAVKAEWVARANNRLD
ncbi:CopG family ribbon-helix-helix protein [Pseudomonas capsici]|uniref:CopG family ribbon-helix-helix protein n=1 Tax=Pseudomonas capsici TaxID=2810614 RepID=UPI000E3C4A8E|nr:ribbon-helix-helix protein, CopG family [Pseudomonas capsici]MBX8606986.1 ribbon-helix-helix protein, CopG family [Pseudomonas cichorii]MCV4344159.1 ribbon-helix-helix protein, CopG family [Pseudomonas capsici]